MFGGGHEGISHPAKTTKADELKHGTGIRDSFLHC